MIGLVQESLDKIENWAKKLASGIYALFNAPTHADRQSVPLQFRPRPEKIVELLVYLAQKKPGADKYLAVKLFYLADREHFIRYGRPITQDRYVAMSYGPVSSTVLDIFNQNKHALRKVGVVEVPLTLVDKRLSSGRNTVAIDAALRDPDMDVFSKSDIRVFDEIVDKYGECSFDQLFKLTHKHYAYDRAWKHRGTSGASPMLYEEMIEDEQKRAAIVRDLEHVAAHF